MSYQEPSGFETLESFIGKEQRMHPHSRGVFSDLLRRIGIASKIVASKVGKAGLLDEAGEQGDPSDHGKPRRKFHLLANDIMKSALGWMPSVVGLASRDEDDVIICSEDNNSTERYIVVYDALDGSSNIDGNVSVGTIFAIYSYEGFADTPEVESFLQPGYKQVAAGYVIYGSSTMFVYTTGHGVHGFTLDPTVGEFILSHENILIPAECVCYSANDRNYANWDVASKRFADHLRYGDEEEYADISCRYVGSLVADFHRNLLFGGVYLYPENSDNQQAKLFLLFECAPLAMIVEQAGGLASTGRDRIRDLRPQSLHYKVPLIIGNRHEVELYERMVHDDDVETGRVKPSRPPR